MKKRGLLILILLAMVAVPTVTDAAKKKTKSSVKRGIGDNRRGRNRKVENVDKEDGNENGKEKKGKCCGLLNSKHKDALFNIVTAATAGAALIGTGCAIGVGIQAAVSVKQRELIRDHFGALLKANVKDALGVLADMFREGYWYLAAEIVVIYGSVVVVAGGVSITLIDLLIGAFREEGGVIGKLLNKLVCCKLSFCGKGEEGEEEKNPKKDEEESDEEESDEEESDEEGSDSDVVVI